MTSGCGISPIEGLEDFADDPSFQEEFMKIKLDNKRTLAGQLERKMNLCVDSFALSILKLRDCTNTNASILIFFTF